MSSSIYSRLALTNIRNNRRSYVPYIITAVLTVMMFYIMDALARNKSISSENLKLCLSYASVVIVVFSVIFLFYTNSFLIKRRKKEIGVYNVLGMGKRHIAKMLCIETVITAALSILPGIVFGIIFGKVMYLVLLKIIHYDIGMKFEISVTAMGDTVVLFLGIFCLTLLYNLLQIRLSDPVQLLSGSSQGEREPKTRWILTIFGVVLTGIGYYIAVTTKSPLEALQLFLIAVICVILGTYALFVAGSIALLKMLRKKKNFYYKVGNFTTVSGMIYRMKQNAVGLANICILSTMVLVMISTTVSLYAGMNDVLKYRFPNEFAVTKYVTTPEEENKIWQIINEETEKEQVTVQKVTESHMGVSGSVRQGNVFEVQPVGDYSSDKVCEVYMVPLADYNQMEGKNIRLADNEVLTYRVGGEFSEKTVVISGTTWKVADSLQEMKLETKNESRVIDAFYIVFPDEEPIRQILHETYKQSDAEEGSARAEVIRTMSDMRYQAGFDLKGNEENCTRAMDNMWKRIDEEVPEAGCECREMSRESFYMLYGGLFFIGIYLGLLFLMATVLIIYYKQISEGYDDKERYQIMQKVGMSRREVKRSIHTQILSVFFLPLIVAVIHICVAFGVITKILAVLNLVNVGLFARCTAATVGVFAVFYGIVFALTAREYYKIVK